MSSTLRSALAVSAAAGVWLQGCVESSYVLQMQPPGAGGATSAGGNGGSPSAGSAGEPANPVCEQSFSPGTNLAVCDARYWGASAADALHGVALTANGEAVIVGESDVQDFAVPTLFGTGAGAGVVARIVSANSQLLAVARIGQQVSDIVAASERVVVASDVGVVALSADLGEIVDAAPIGDVTRVDAAGDFVAAVTADGRALLLDASLDLIHEVALAPWHPEDVAVDEQGNLFVTGWREPRAGGACRGHVPFIEAYSKAKALLWRAYGFDDAPGWCASSSGRRLVVRGEQLLYVGEQEGGNSVHLRDPGDVSVQAPLVAYDAFSNGAGKAIDVYSFVARFASGTGLIEAGQVVLPRDDTGVGGTLFSSALAVDEAGRIFVGGRAGCCLERRAERHVAGEPVGDFAGEEASLLVLSADLREREIWTTFTAAGPTAAGIEGIAVDAGMAVLVATADAAGDLIVHPPGATARQGAADGYVVSFPAR